jgi:hypothetical protein
LVTNIAPYSTNPSRFVKKGKEKRGTRKKQQIKIKVNA